jgi:protease-4
VQMLDPAAAAVVVNAGLDIALDNYELSGGGVYGSALGLDGAGFYAGAALRSFNSESSLPMPAKVVRVRLETTPTLRQHTRFLKALWRLSRDREVEGVVLELRAAPAASLAATEELADAVGLLRERGKKVLCHLEDADGRSLYLCSHADRIALNPAGGVRFAGVSSRYFYFGGLLEKLGVQADFVRIGAHKLAPEQLTTEQGSATGRQDHMATVRAIEDVVVDAIVRGRKLDRTTARDRIAAGPYLARDARDAKLVDTLAYQDEIDRFAEESLGHPVRVVDLDLPELPPAYWGEPPKLAIVYLDGEMIDGQSTTIPLLDIKLAGSYTVAKALKQAREDSTVHAVVLRVDTGGGSALCADLILREVSLTARVKPVVVSMAAKAASGGYYAAVGGQEIFANRGTLTGSIGIFYGKVDVVGLMDKLGVKSESVEGMPRADADSFFRPYSDDERRELGLKVKQLYDLFVGRVSEARKLSPADVHAVAQGRVWTGDQALERHLVDHVGGLRQAIAHARQLSGLPEKAEIVELPEEPTSLLSLVLEVIGLPLVDAQASGWTPPPIGEIARALLPFMLFEAHKPLALMDLSVRDP